MILTPEQLAAEMAVQTAGIDAEVAIVAHLSAEVGATQARSLVPVDTGRLRDSITADEDSFGSDVDYAAFVEYGTFKDAPQPYMGPAADHVTPLFAAGVLEAGTF